MIEFIGAKVYLQTPLKGCVFFQKVFKKIDLLKGVK